MEIVNQEVKMPFGFMLFMNIYLLKVKLKPQRYFIYDSLKIHWIVIMHPFVFWRKTSHFLWHSNSLAQWSPSFLALWTSSGKGEGMVSHVQPNPMYAEMEFCALALHLLGLFPMDHRQVQVSRPGVENPCPGGCTDIL